MAIMDILAKTVLGHPMSSNKITIKPNNHRVYQCQNEKKIELLNKIISENRQIEIHWVSKDELDKFPLRKKPKVNENIRIIEVGKFDYSPCGGTHTKSSSELGIIKVLKWIKVKNGFRVDFICGERALSDYQWKNKMILEIAEFLAVKKKDLKDSVEKLFEQNKTQRKQIEEMQYKLLEDKFKKELNQTQKIEGIPVVKLIFNEGNFKISDFRNYPDL